MEDYLSQARMTPEEEKIGLSMIQMIDPEIKSIKMGIRFCEMFELLPDKKWGAKQQGNFYIVEWGSLRTPHFFLPCQKISDFEYILIPITSDMKVEKKLDKSTRLCAFYFLFQTPDGVPHTFIINFESADILNEFSARVDMIMEEDARTRKAKECAIKISEPLKILSSSPELLENLLALISRPSQPQQ